jgi:hypothetical protein
VLAAVINRAAFTGSMTRFGHVLRCTQARLLSSDDTR